MIAINEPLYVTRAAGTRLLRVFLLVSCILVLALIVVGILIQPAQIIIWLIVAASRLMPVVLVWLIVPEGFEVWDDRLRLIFPLFGWDLPFDTIESIQPARWWQSYAFRGIRFATSPAGSVVILRRSGRTDWVGTTTTGRSPGQPEVHSLVPAQMRRWGDNDTLGYNCST